MRDNIFLGSLIYGSLDGRWLGLLIRLQGDLCKAEGDSRKSLGARSEAH